jgi:drug/metabolite transporter (DMT)-like permease
MDRTTDGWGSGLLGVIIFSGSLPATRVAVGDFSPLFLTSARAVIAALLGAAFLVVLRQVRPARGDLGSLAVVALGVVVGFPLLTALALQRITSAHSIVFIGLLPLATAIFGVLRGGERPQPAFWLFSGLGGAIVAGFALHNGGAASLAGDTLMVAAILLCGLGYAEGATLSRRLGGWQVISWALLLALPIMAAVALTRRRGPGAESAVRLGSGSPMFRSSACWSASYSGIAASRSEALRGWGSCSCSSHSSAWRWRACCFMSRSPGR